MTATVQIDKRGRIVIPKEIRDVLHLRAGDKIEIEYVDGEVILRRQRVMSSLV
jgi:AbrB family looped-hinge helix DNA binding protein